MADLLAQQLGLPVLDKTGLAGTYDFLISWEPVETGAASSATEIGQAGTPSSPDSDSAVLVAAVLKQLGLRLESVKTSVNVVVVDGAQQPSAN